MKPMHTLEVTILDPQAETVIEELESKHMIRIARSEPNGEKRKPRKFGSMPGLVTYISDDFDEPLEDFKDYMPE